MAIGDAYVFPGFLTPVLTQLFFPKSPTTFLTCFCRGKRRKYAGKKSRLNRGSNSQPPGRYPTRSLLSHPGGGQPIWNTVQTYIAGKKKRKGKEDILEFSHGYYKIHIFEELEYRIRLHVISFVPYYL